MTDWYAEVGRPGRFSRTAIWVVAIAVSVLVNGSVAVQLESFLMEGRSQLPQKNEEVRALDVRVLPLEDRFVEANPEVPTNPPDETTNFGARDQQAAEPEPDPAGESSFPQRDSEEDSQTFVERGDTEKRLPPGVYSESATASEATRADDSRLGELAPLVEKETPEWIESRVEGVGDQIPEARKGEEEESKDPDRLPGMLVLNDDGAASPAETPATATNNPEARPLPRKKVGADVLLAPLARSEKSAPRRGQLAVDSRLTDYGDYTQRALEAIQAEWHQLTREVSVGAGSRFSSVEVKFIIDTEGSIEEAKIVETTAGQLASMICLDAIYARAPYGRWTDDMKKTLGDREEVTITFNY